MSVIYCIIHLFDHYNNVYKMNEKNEVETIGKVTIKDAYKKLANLCYSESIYTIRLYGNKEFASLIAKKIKKYEGLTFSGNKIKVEVNNGEIFN